MLYTVEDIKKIVAPIASEHGVERVWLFGSYARGEATPDSDIDLRVDKGRIEGYFQLGGLYVDLEEAFGDVKVDLLTTGSLEDDFLASIAQEEILIYG
ncbi:MAG: nucleotidyltransferase domain-containing protein [Deltaproteobacteria bacterium]|jgi:predicted nucleotidyltransferase|nr:nucleotidyltransferase domain-containing protein [Deltaproteobacteria bacterium]